MLASSEDGNLDAFKFSLASEIVELVVLTRDDAFLQTLREAVGGSRRLWHVLSSDKVSDLLVAGQVGILVLDVLALNETATVFVSQIKRQFPDLVVVVAGNRQAETQLASLISVGLIYRFIHKPMSPARARLFADAAVKRYDEQRRRVSIAPVKPPSAPTNPRLLIGAGCGVLAMIAAAVGYLHNASRDESLRSEFAIPAPAESPLLTRAAAALAANRLAPPATDNALDLYLQQLARNPSDAAARAGLAEVHERLLARAENALLEERLDEAAAAIETARKSGVESGRIAFLNAQLVRSRALVKPPVGAAQSKSAAQSTASGNDDAGAVSGLTEALSLAAERLQESRLLEPDKDSARYYVERALRIAPNSAAAAAAEQSLAMALVTETHSAIDRRDFTRAAGLLDGARGIASPTNLDNLEQLLRAARQQAQSEAWQQLLKTAQERVQQDRLIEPANDSAKYYFLTLRGVDPANAGLAAVSQDLGARLIQKARRALALQQYDAARSWLDEAAAIDYSSPEASSVARDLKSAKDRQKFLDDVVAADQLTMVKSVHPVYPTKAQASGIEGWVELDFTVTEEGQVADISVHNASPPGIFDSAASAALAQWRFRPVEHDAKPAAQRARLRIRFTLGG